MLFYLVLVHDVAAMLMQSAGDESQGNPDFRGENQQSINSLRSEMNVFQQTAETKRSTMQNSWKSSFDNAVAAINTRLGEIQRNMAAASTSYRDVKTVNQQLVGVEKQVSTTTNRALKSSGKAEAELSKLEDKFQTAADKQAGSWNSAESKQIQSYAQEVMKSQQNIHKAVSSYAGFAQGVNSKSMADAIKADLKMNKMGQKYEDKFEGEAQDLDEEYAHFDDSMNSNELYLEHLTDDTTSVLQSHDPKKTRHRFDARGGRNSNRRCDVG